MCPATLHGTATVPGSCSPDPSPGATAGIGAGTYTPRMFPPHPRAMTLRADQVAGATLDVPERHDAEVPPGEHASAWRLGYDVPIIYADSGEIKTMTWAEWRAEVALQMVFLEGQTADYQQRLKATADAWKDVAAERDAAIARAEAAEFKVAQSREFEIQASDRARKAEEALTSRRWVDPDE